MREWIKVHDGAVPRLLSDRRWLIVYAVLIVGMILALAVSVVGEHHGHEQDRRACHGNAQDPVYCYR